MIYPGFQFSKHLHFSQRNYGHCYIRATYTTYGTSGKVTFGYIVCKDFRVYISASATCAISGTSGTDLTTVITPLGKYECLENGF